MIFSPYLRKDIQWGIQINIYVCLTYFFNRKDIKINKNVFQSGVKLDESDMERIENSLKRLCFVDLTLHLCKHFYSYKIKFKQKKQVKEKFNRGICYQFSFCLLTLKVFKVNLKREIF